MTIAETRATDETTTSSAQPPLAVAKPAFVAAFLALLLVAAGVLGVRDAAVAVGWLRGDLLIPKGVNAIAEFGPQQWMVPAGVALAVLGVALAVLALFPRRPTAVPVEAATTVYVGHGDVARIASAVTLDVPGVLKATCTASSRTVVVRCRVTGHADDVRVLVTAAVADALEPLRHTPRIVVRVRKEELS